MPHMQAYKAFRLCRKCGEKALNKFLFYYILCTKSSTNLLICTPVTASASGHTELLLLSTLSSHLLFYRIRGRPYSGQPLQSLVSNYQVVSGLYYYIPTYAPFWITTALGALFTSPVLFHTMPAPVIPSAEKLGSVNTEIRISQRSS